jgi:hypothetical protein
LLNLKTNKVIDFFTSSTFNQTIIYLTNYFSAGEVFGNDLELFTKFSNIEDVTGVLQNALKLVNLIEKFEPQILL